MTQSDITPIHFHIYGESLIHEQRWERQQLGDISRKALLLVLTNQDSGQAGVHRCWCEFIR